MKRIITIIVFLLLIAGIGYFNFASEMLGGSWQQFRFRLGLDLAGGTELVYDIDTTGAQTQEVADSLSTLKEVIERRVNLFGVSEPLIQIERPLQGDANRLIVQLPGVADIDDAIRLIGETPFLEFRVLGRDLPTDEEILKSLPVDEVFIPTGITGRLLTRAQVVFQSSSIAAPSEPAILLEFNEEGRELVAKVTKENVGNILGIFLDGQPISTPRINEAISDGKAQISGNFTAEAARDLARNLNYGALPLPINLINTEKVGPTLGQATLWSGVQAGVIGFLLIALFLIVWYRVPGLVASLTLIFYLLILLALFKLIPVTITSAGIAGLILSLGMAVDSNILVFARIKEEIKRGRSIKEAVDEGFSRAWFSIRDSNISGILSSIILFWFGTALVKGFALTLILGVLVSLITAIAVTRTLLRAVVPMRDGKVSRFLFSSGISK